ncbi:hypothetical protein YTPLAS21_19470 [Candidatus Nitrosocosmicus sp.]|nr:hypothetical protein YTPLAS21_19470 [Candidatus Nitrosocosmicus sp.]
MEKSQESKELEAVLRKQDELKVKCKSHLIEIRKLVKFLDREMESLDIEKQVNAVVFVSEWLRVTMELLQHDPNHKPK